ncbi:dipeptidase PepV [Bacillus sp. AGMB 02131]|uniref:Dipeptidase PepV n=1 Tax=Peribacillus faecalis TaxID=2772559 RepID=A0A927D2U1_9BACI|nr:dipeptidase PepV [Peribacillus faecalis]MBD3110515.1 dipeptidase PepV [Peribacillus faecalis]
MNQINWTEEVNKRKEQLIKDTQEFLRIKSVLDEENATPEAPLGKGVQEALQYMLKKGENDGYTVKDVEHLAGHIEMGKGEDILGILCHVDVVPEGDGWSSDPYGAEIRDGKIFARGVLDDKGPTMAAYYAMNIVKELGLPLSKRVRMIIGTDEESEWRCVDTYFKHEEMPTLGFAPDADFPIIFAEKGIWDFYMNQAPNLEAGSADITVKQFESGRRFNMVPDYATAVLEVKEAPAAIKTEFEAFLAKNELKGAAKEEGNTIVLELEGVSAHGMEPKNGVNAGLYLSLFLNELPLSKHANDYFTFVVNYLFNDSRGKSFGIAYNDEETGDVTLNVGLMRYSKEEGGQVGINLRYPVSYGHGVASDKLQKVLKENHFALSTLSHSKPHHVKSDSFLVQTLSKVYEGQTGEKAELIAIGGGTYARSLEAGVAFGPLFPGREDIAHQKDEYMYIEDLLKATALYAEAIYELAK